MKQRISNDHPTANDGAGSTSSDSHGFRGRFATRGQGRVLSIAVFVALAGVAAATAGAVRSTLSDQEAKLLEERSSEASVLLDTAFNGFASRCRSSPRSLGRRPTTRRRSKRARQPSRLADRPQDRSRRGTRWRAGRDRGRQRRSRRWATRLDGPRRDLAERASGGKGLVTDVFADGDERRLRLAISGVGRTRVRRVPRDPPGDGGPHTVTT